MAIIVKRDGSELPVTSKPALPNRDIKGTALHVIADHAIITEWDEVKLNDGRIQLRLECIIDKDKIR